MCKICHNDTTWHRASGIPTGGWMEPGMDGVPESSSLRPNSVPPWTWTSLTCFLSSERERDHEHFRGRLQRLNDIIQDASKGSWGKFSICNFCAFSNPTSWENCWCPRKLHGSRELGESPSTPFLPHSPSYKGRHRPELPSFLTFNQGLKSARCPISFLYFLPKFDESFSLEPVEDFGGNRMVIQGEDYKK